MPTTDTITITVPRAAAEKLAQHWSEGCSNLDVVRDVRDLLDGRDGYLHTLHLALRGAH